MFQYRRKWGILLLLCHFICISYDVIKVKFNISGSLETAAQRYSGLKYMHDRSALNA